MMKIIPTTFLKSINKIIRVLVLGDILFFSAFGLVTPIFAIFITKQIAGATIATVGFATTVTLLTRAILQMPVARFVDKRKGEKDDFFMMIIGSTLVSLVPFAYMFIRTPLGLYAAQMALGIGAAMGNPGWYAIFTRHIDKNREGTEWTLENVSVGLSAAGAAAVGGILAQQFGFRNLFFIVGILSLIGVIVLISLYSTVINLDHKVNGDQPGNR